MASVTLGPPEVSATREEREHFVETYAHLALRIPGVIGIETRDLVSSVVIRTIYRGPYGEIDARLDEAEQQANRLFPSVRVDWQLTRQLRSAAFIYRQER